MVLAIWVSAIVGHWDVHILNPNLTPYPYLTHNLAITLNIYNFNLYGGMDVPVLPNSKDMQYVALRQT